MTIIAAFVEIFLFWTKTDHNHFKALPLKKTKKELAELVMCNFSEFSALH